MTGFFCQIMSLQFTVIKAMYISMWRKYHCKRQSRDRSWHTYGINLQNVSSCVSLKVIILSTNDVMETLMFDVWNKVNLNYTLFIKLDRLLGSNF